MSLCINPSLFSCDSDSPYYACLVISCHLEHQLLVSELNLYSSSYSSNVVFRETLLKRSCAFNLDLTCSQVQTECSNGPIIFRYEHKISTGLWHVLTVQFIPNKNSGGPRCFRSCCFIIHVFIYSALFMKGSFHVYSTRCLKQHYHSVYANIGKLLSPVASVPRCMFSREIV